MSFTPHHAIADDVREPAVSIYSPRVAQAIALEHGEGVPKDPVAAADLYCAAARDGDLDGLHGLAWLYAHGRGVQRDDGVAGALLAKAAESGHAHAQRVLGLFNERAALPDCLTIRIAISVENPAAAPVPEAIEPAPVDPFANLPVHKKKIVEMVKDIAPRFAVEPKLALAVIAAESNFEPQARSPKDARGLMQLIPGTAARFNVRNVLDPLENVRGGLRYLRWLLAYYQGRVDLVAAAYNAGEGMVDQYGGIPPFRETREYVEKIMRVFQSGWHPYDPLVADPSKMIDGVRGEGRVHGSIPPKRTGRTTETRAIGR